jgi:hypothetical protein
VWGSGPNDVWAVANDASDRGIFHWDGHSGSSNPTTIGGQLTGVWGSGANDVWIVGLGGMILHH